MATVPIGVRLDEELLARIDHLAERTGSTRTDIVDRALRIGLKEDEGLAQHGPAILKLMRLMLSKPFVDVFFTLVGDEVDPKQLGKIKKLYEEKTGKKWSRSEKSKELYHGGRRAVVE
jgi:hypothetical protein